MPYARRSRPDIRTPPNACRAAQAAELASEFARQDPALEPVGNVGQDAIANEGAHGFPDEALFVAQQRGNVEKVDRVGRRRAHGGARHRFTNSCRHTGRRRGSERKDRFERIDLLGRETDVDRAEIVVEIRHALGTRNGDTSGPLASNHASASCEGVQPLRAAT